MSDAATKFTFYADVDVVGPYLPKEPSVVNENYEIEQLGTLQIPRLDPVAAKISTEPTKDEVLLTQEYKEVAYNPAKFFFVFTLGTPSGYTGYHEAVSRSNTFCSLLSLTVPGNRYYYKINAVGMEPTKDFPTAFESPPSDPLFIASYEGSTDFLKEQTIFIKSVRTLFIKDLRLQKMLNLFNQGLSAEYRQGNETAVISYFKVMELVSNYLDNTKTQEQKNKGYADVILKLQDVLNSKSQPFDVKVKAFREATILFRKIDNDITSENIENAGIKFKLDGELIGRLKVAIKFRNKIVAHTSVNTAEVALKDNRDFRELAKIFIINYIGQIHKVNIEILNTVETKKEHAVWYRSSYLNSCLQDKAKEMGLINS